MGLVVVAYVVITLVMTHPLVNLGALATACYGGDTRLMIWTLAWDNHAVLNHLPLFGANIFYPAAGALSYNDHLFALSLFTLPIYAITHNPILAYNIAWLAAFPLNALAMFALVLRYTNRRVAAFIAGVIYAFSFYNMLHAPGHLSLIWTWLMPLSLLLFERWLERPTPGRAAWWGAAVVLQALTSWYLAVIVLVASAIVCGWRAALVVRDRFAVRAGHVVLVVAAVGAAVWPFARHYVDLAQVPTSEAVGLSADWASYIVPPENTLAGQWWIAHVGTGPRWIWGEQTLFVGWIAIALAIGGIAAMFLERRPRVIGAYLVCVAVGLALSFGPASGLHGPRITLFDLLARLPGVGGFRAPARFALLALLGVSVGAGYGVATVERRFPRATAIAAVALVPLMLCEWFLVKLPMTQPQPAPTPAIYLHPALATAHAYVSLPDYRAAKEWYNGGDYLLFSTATWTPIVNGYGRSEPQGFLHEISHMNAFPGPNNAKTMRELGVEYVVLRAGAYPDGAAGLLHVALAEPDYELVARIGTDYLFHVRP
jgi:hypothetical protein